MSQKSTNKEEDLSMAVKNYFESSNISPTVQIRYRPPLIRTTTHDARGDAISLAFESMSHRNFPFWASWMLAYEFVEIYAEELQTAKVPFTDDYKVLDANIWCGRVTEMFESFIKQLADRARSLPVMPKEWNRFPISLCSQRNRKPKMEDRHIILPTLAVVEPDIEFEGKYKDSFFAVFDGHHGAECAAYANAHFVECLFESLSETEDIEAVLKDTFDRMDKRITIRCRNENIASGTTASCVYLKDGKIAYLAWCGDSSIGLLRTDEVVTLSKPHKPEDPVRTHQRFFNFFLYKPKGKNGPKAEMKRIEDAGGMVVNVSGVPRLNGVLNLSRSLGDIRAKPMVSPKPDLRTYPISSEHDYILFLSSDGVWDSLDEFWICEAVRGFVTEHAPEDYHLMAEHIAGKAKENGSADNLTLICVFLKPVKEVWKQFAFSPI